MAKEIDIKRKYDRIAIFYDAMENIIENRIFKKWRQAYIPKLTGNILEIGVGTGKNLPYYNKNAKVIGIDISSKMLSRAKNKLEKLGNKNIKLLEMDAQCLDFEDESFDSVVTTFVWCTVPWPVKGLSEARRVLKNGGQAHFVEHVLSENKILALLENVHNPVTRLVAGVNVNRDTKANIIKAGFNVVEDKKLAYYDIFRYFKAEKL